MNKRVGLGMGVAWLLAITGCPADPAPSDGGNPVDASALDARSCASGPDCDDGLFCNGEEVCNAGRCEAGAQACDDDVACTFDFCSEEQRRCLHQASDDDGDGYRSAACHDARGMPLGTDCDDGNIARFPGNLEVCDAAGLDEDCDTSTLGERDADGDGHPSSMCCNALDDGTMRCGDDCDDARAGVFPAATEVCDGVDNDCDTHVDEGLVESGFADADRDGFGDDAMPLMACPGGDRFATVGGDCNDASPAQRPMQPEFCDMADNDCDTNVDESAAPVPWFLDRDGDGFGSSVTGTVVSCEPVAGATLIDSDCDDTARTISPAASELCNGRDDNCNGRADFVIGEGDFEDDDGDGVADLRCGMPFGLDCDDLDPGAGPGSPEVCNGRDDDCDSRTDEGAMSSVYYRDLDMDTYGSSTSGTTVACGPPSMGYVVRGGDCNDADPMRHPSAAETCDGADQDCDAAVDETPAVSSCALAGGITTAQCTSGRCEVAACSAGLTDCDHSYATGCEVDLLRDRSNCGACGHVCDGGTTCLGGVCGWSILSPGGDFAEITRPADTIYTIDAATAGATIYYTRDGSVPYASPTTMSGTPPLSLTLTDGETVRWFASAPGGPDEPIHTFTHHTDPASSRYISQIATNVSLAGQGPAARVMAGSSVSITMNLQEWMDGAGGYCPGCITQGVIQIEDFGIIDCLNGRTAHPGRTRAISTSFTAPMAPGRYRIRVGADWRTACDALVGANIGREIVGVLEVF